MNVKNLFKNLLSKSKGYADIAENNAKSYTDEAHLTNTQNLSLNSGFSLSSWGSAILTTYGKLNIITVFGFRSSSAISSSKQFTKLDGEYLFAGGLLGTGSSNPNAIVRVDTSGNVYVDSMIANTNYYGQLVFIKVGGVILNLLNALSERGCVA